MFSQTVEYALRAMMYLASLGDTAVTSERIAVHTHVPPGYLSKVMRDLVVANLVTSFRGPGGGFVAARPPEAITILDVVEAVDPVRRVPKSFPDHPEHAALSPMYRRLDEALAQMERALRSTTLAQVLAGAEGNEPKSGQSAA